MAKRKRLQLSLPLNDCHMIVRADGSLSTHGGNEHGPMIILTLMCRECGHRTPIPEESSHETQAKPSVESEQRPG